MRKTFLSLITACLIGSVAHAQAPISWGGFKAGLSLGALNYTNTWTDTDYDWYGGSLSYPKRKLAPAIHAGWDAQTGSLVYGAELDYSFDSAKRTEIYSTRVTKTDELKSVTTLRGRMGLATANALVYVTAGVAKAKADHTWIEAGDPNDSWPTFSNSHTGFVYGLGLEHRVSQLVSLRAEYQHVNIPEVSSTNNKGFTMEVGEDVTTFSFGASFHF